MRLKFANCLSQKQQVFYRLDYNFFGEPDAGNRFRTARSLMVDAGRQVVIGGDLVQQQVDSIIKQLEIYGALKVEEMGRLPRKVVPSLLSIDKDVPAKLIVDVMKHNKGVLTSIGRERRETAAVVANEAVEKAVAAQASLQKFEVEIEQQDPEPGEAEITGSRLEEGLRVAHTPVERQSAKKPSRKRNDQPQA